MRGKTGRPRDIDNWREWQYLDLQRRQIHIPPGLITAQMLKGLLGTGITCGKYGGTGVTTTHLGDVVFIPSLTGSKYGQCVYCTIIGGYGIHKYGQCQYR